MTRRAGGIRLLTLAVAVIGLALAALACQTEPASLPGETDRPAVAFAPPPTAAGPAPAETSLQPTADVGYAPPTPGPAPEITDADIDNLAALIEAMTQPRPVTADAIWAYLMAERGLSTGVTMAQNSPASVNQSKPEETTARMLEMWHLDSPCFALLETEITALEDNNPLSTVRYVQYLDYVTTLITPCLDAELPRLAAEQFFKNSSAARTARITRWFDQSWSIQTDPPLIGAVSCREGFYAHIPDAVAATEPHQIAAALDVAQSGLSECLEATAVINFRLMELDAAQTLDLPPEQRRRVISLQNTAIGHLIAVGLGKEYAECWPDFEAKLPQVAAATNPGDLTDRQDAAIDSLVECIAQLPPDNPFERQ